MKKIAWLVILFVLLGVSNAFCESRIISDTTHKLGLGLKLENVYANSFSFKERNADRKNGMLIGAFLDYGITRWLSLELAYSSSLNEEIEDTTIGVKLADLKISPLTFSVKLRYISKDPEEYKWIVPYLILGLGYYNVDADVSDRYQAYNSPNETDLDFDSGFGWHAGLGVAFFLNDKVSMNVEGRYFQFDSKVKETQYNPELNISSSYDENVNISAWQIGVGLQFYFDLFRD